MQNFIESPLWCTLKDTNIALHPILCNTNVHPGYEGDGCRCSDEGTLNKETQEFKTDAIKRVKIKLIDCAIPFTTKDPICQLFAK